MQERIRARSGISLVTSKKPHGRKFWVWGIVTGVPASTKGRDLGGPRRDERSAIAGQVFRQRKSATSPEEAMKQLGSFVLDM